MRTILRRNTARNVEFRALPTVKHRSFSGVYQTEQVHEFMDHVTSNSSIYDLRRELNDKLIRNYRAYDSTEIHPTAIVHPQALIGSGVQIGPYAIVGANVTLADRVELKAHTIVDGDTVIGKETVVFPFSCIGGPPQDKKHNPHTGVSALVIGERCVIREHVTIHGSTSYSVKPTSIGDECWILCGAHIGHDSQLGKRIVLSNNVCVAGHVEIGDFAIIGGQAGLKQHIKIGSLVMIGGKSAVDGDVLPFGLVMGNRARLAGLNLVGLRRSRVSREDIKTMLRIYRYLFNSIPSGFAPALDLEYHENVVARAEQVQNYLDNHVKMTQQEINPMITEMVHFVIDSRKRVRSSLCTPLENK